MELCAAPHLYKKPATMITQDILTADVLDIVFDNRNKAYGAYTLRKYYNKTLVNALGMMLALVATICLLSFRFGKKPSENIQNEKPDIIISDIILKTDEPKEKPMEQKPSVPQKKFNTQQNTPIKIEPDYKVTEENKVPDQVVLDTKATDVKTVSGVSDGSDVVISKNTSNPGNGETKTGEENIDPTNPIASAEVNPSFPGGMEALQNFLHKNLRTPDELEAGQRASVKVQFIVGHKGEVYGYEVVQSGGDAFDAEVIRVLKKMPKWIPGVYKGQNVSVYYVIPVKFEAFEE